jgi:tripeptidyl-peptidase-1
MHQTSRRIQSYAAQVIVLGKTMVVGGTSASSPTFAGIVSLLTRNDSEARLQAGKRQLGYLTPLLYSMAADNFYDITVGSSRIGNAGTRLSQGWDCVTGWDPVSGRGTPNFGRMLATVLALP